MVKSLLAIWDTWVQSLGQEDPLEKEMATHSVILAWKIPWTEESDGLQSMGLQNSWTLSGEIPYTGCLIRQRKHLFHGPGGRKWHVL